RTEHPHERMAGKFFVRNLALQQPNHLGKAGVEVEFLGLAEGFGLATKQKLGNGVARQVRDLVSVEYHASSPPFTDSNRRRLRRPLNSPRTRPDTPTSARSPPYDAAWMARDHERLFRCDSTSDKGRGQAPHGASLPIRGSRPSANRNR